VLSPQHKEALLKQLVINLVALFIYNIKAALTRSKEVTIFIFNVQGTFNALLKRQLFKRITEQSWSFSLF
jgi:hypothetical protein